MAAATTPVHRQALVLCVIAAFPALATALWHPRWPTRNEQVLASHEITLATALGWPNVLWLDARPDADFRHAHVPGALPLQDAQWERDLPAVLQAWQPGMKVVVYCSAEGCAASARVAERLRRDLASDDVYFLHGGYEAWQAARK